MIWTMAKKDKSAKATSKGKKKEKGEGKPERKSRSSTGKNKSRVMDATPDDSKFRNSLESDGLTIAEMAPDGNCLFRALSDQLYGDYGNHHEEIRSDICDYMEENKDDFTVFLVLDDDSCEEGDDGKDFESYMRTMRQDGEWGGNLELVAAARLYQRKITVFSEILSAYSIEPGEEKPSGPDILVSFHDNDHYNSVRDEKSPPKPPPKRNKQKGKDVDRRAPRKELSQASDTTIATATTSSSVSDMSIDNQSIPQSSASQTNKPVKKSAPCPCGSGQRFKKCCYAMGKHSARLEKLKVESSEDAKEEEGGELETRGNFRVLQI